MSKLTVYGASDDLIEIEGDIEEEWYATTGEGADLLAFSDGTLLEIVYTDSGFWRINALSRNTSTRIEKHEGSDLDSDYSPSEDDPYVDDFGHELECTHCGGDGECDDNANPLWDCDDNPHACHSCGGSGKRRDQTIF